MALATTETTERFGSSENGRGVAELVVDVQVILVLVLGVADVEEVEVDALVCSAEVEDDHGAPTISEPNASPPKTRRQNGRKKGEKRRGAAAAVEGKEI